MKKEKKAQLLLEFGILIKKYLNNEHFLKMKNYIQHGTTTTLKHAIKVAWVAFVINRKYKLNANEEELIQAALLHDFYLYDWHDGEPIRKRHGFDHPFIAAKNAKEYFDVNETVENAIKSHMWPLNITTLPKGKVAVILCLADKCSALKETLKL